MDSKIIAVADFGTSKITIVAGQKDSKGKITILGSESNATEEGSIRSGMIIRPASVSYTVSQLIKLVENRIGKTIGNLYIGLNAYSMRTCIASLKEKTDPKQSIEQDLLDKMTNKIAKYEFENRSIYNIVPQEYQLDTDPIDNPLKKKGSLLIGNYVVFTGKKEIADNIDKCINRSNCTIAEMVASPLSTSLAVLSDKDKDDGCILIDFGAGTTTVSIFKDGYLRHSTIIPFGGKHITKDLESLNISADDAESLKIHKGSAQISDITKNLKIQVPSTRKDVATEIITETEMVKIIEARLHEILNFAKEKITKSELADTLTAGVIITGGGSKLNGIEKLTSEILEMKVRKGSCEHILNKQSQDWNQPENAAALGLLLYGNAECITTKAQSRFPQNRSKWKTFGDGMINFFSDESRIEE